MGRVGKKRKRYLLFRQSQVPSAETREAFSRLLAKRYPELGKSAFVWVDDGLIVKSDHTRYLPLREEVESLTVGGFGLRAVSASGSISKLKRLAAGEDGWR